MAQTWIIRDSEQNEVNRIYAGEDFMVPYMRTMPPDYTYEPEPSSPEPEPEPTDVERLRADVDYIAVMTGIDL